MTQVKNVVDAIDAFITGCKADGNWNAIKASCIMAGWGNTAGALTPLKGTAPTNVGFVAGDYDRRLGLVGDRATKRLESNRADNADPQDSSHLFIYASTPPTGMASGALPAYGGSGDGSTSYRAILALNAVSIAGSPVTDNGFYIRTAGYRGPKLGIASGALGISRSSSSQFLHRTNGYTITEALSSAAPSSGTLQFFTIREGGNITSSSYSNPRLAFYSIGESVDLALLEGRVNTLMASLRAAVPYDSDAAAYITAVEAADGQTLEPAIKDAINAFVVACKSDGTWNAIKASCILAGARTLNGALVPLKGSAPTNVNFLAGDYNRRTGLAGDGSTKYLDSNRANNADPQNSHHYGAYVSSFTAAGDFPALMSSTLYGSTGATQLYRRRVGGDRWEAQSRNSTAQTSTNLTFTAPTFVGVSRGSSSTCTVRAGGTSGSNSITSQVPGPETTKIFSYGTSANFQGRVAYYSIGESLDLALLDARVTQLMAAISTAVLDDSDAMAYIAAVEAADGQSLEPAVKSAINAFVVGCKSSGIWDAIKASCILAGARTLNGALVPLKGTAPTNFNFVAGDYNRKTGLLGDGSTKYLNSSRNIASDPQNNSHIAVYASSIGSGAYIGADNGGVGDTFILSDSSNASWPFRHRISAFNASSQGLRGTNIAGLIALTRSASTTCVSRVNGTNETLTSTSTTIPSRNCGVFCRIGSGGALNHSASRLAFYSIGESLDLALLDARVTQLMAALATAIP